MCEKYVCISSRWEGSYKANGSQIASSIKTYLFSSHPGERVQDFYDIDISIGRDVTFQVFCLFQLSQYIRKYHKNQYIFFKAIFCVTLFSFLVQQFPINLSSQQTISSISGPTKLWSENLPGWQEHKLTSLWLESSVLRLLFTSSFHQSIFH